MIPNIAVILTDARRRILWVNDGFTKISGYTLSEAIGKVPGSLLQGPETEKEAVQEIRRGLNRFTPVQQDILNYRKNGEPYTCRLVIHPIFNSERELTNYIAFEADKKELNGSQNLPILQLSSKYRSSSLKGMEELQLYERLKDLMENDKLFLDPNLTLRSTADKLATNTKYLSQVVNRHTGGNFQQFVNNYRVEAAKLKIGQEEFSNLTLYGIALQCGFKNKSTFYKVFKEMTQMTPKEYLEDLKKVS